MPGSSSELLHRPVAHHVSGAIAQPEWDPTLGAEVRSLADRLLPIFYADLKRVAHHERARVAAGMTLQTTALVHEAYLKLRGSTGWNDDAHFVRAAAIAMRHALVDHARDQLTVKRGEGAEHLQLTDSLGVAEASDEMLLALNDAVEQLAAHSLRLAQVVECRYFAGYDEVATAKALGISERTVRRDWTLARAWLLRELGAS
jgi:RNA polymerase sigma factor (TIGR02999 family)